MEKLSPSELIKRYLSGEATAEEAALVESWYLDELQKNEYSPDKELIDTKYAEMRAGILAITGKRRVIRLWPRIAVAASILIAVLSGLYFIVRTDQNKPLLTASAITNLPPGNQTAFLVLSNGDRVNLKDVETGSIAMQSNTEIIKTADNKIIYKPGKQTDTVAYNTLVTNAGNYYPLTLADGTIAILDAGSSIRYPVSFTGNERRVKITGQVYFEVKHNAAMPFRVSVRGQLIEDLGTSFNINAYDDEPDIKATLIEGSMRVNNEATLKPGQQASIKNGAIKVSKADVEQVIAWKNGVFKFNETPIAEGMRQLSRWYNVEIAYPEGVPPIVFNGEVHRNSNAAEVLEILSFSKVHFQIVNTRNRKKILIKP